MQVKSFYPVLAVEDVGVTSRFFLQYFPFGLTFEADWYVSLRTRTEPHFELAFVQRDHPSVPSAYRRAVQGVLLSFEVEDVDGEHERLKAAGVAIEHELRSEEWGQRHFIASAPGEVLVDVIQIIPPSDAALAQYIGAGREEALGAAPDGSADSAQ